jgi:hypothetical protein
MSDVVENSSSSTVISHSYKDIKIAIKLSRHDHYHKWVFLMKQLLIRTSNWNEEESQPLDSSASFSIISENIHEDHLDLIMDETLASAAWIILKKKFAGKSVSHQLSCIRSLVEFKYSSNMQGNLNSLRSIGRSLIAASGGEDKIDILNLIAIFALESLPEEFIGTKAVLSLKSSVSLQAIEDAIIQAPLSGPNATATAPISQISHAHQAKASDGTKCSHGRFPTSCWSCHPDKRPVCEKCKSEGRKFYHKTGSRFCSFVGNQANKGQIQAYITSSSSAGTSWVVDSGCSDHMTPAASALETYTPSDRKILTASGSAMSCQGEGTSTIQAGTSQVRLSNVLHSNSLSENLLSVSSLADKGHVTLFDKNNSYTVTLGPAVNKSIESLRTHAFLIGERIGGLYIAGPTAHAAMAHATPLSRDIWHQRLGHLNYSDLEKLPSLAEGIAFTGAPDPDCVACIKHKTKRSSHPSSDTRASGAGELLHIDLGVLNEAYSFQGHRYYLLFVDDHSRYSFIFFLQKKSESAQIITNLIEHVNNHTGKYPRYIRSDNALEFFTNTLNSFLASKGIIHQSSCAYTPEQNGVVERMNQTIANAGNSMLEASGLHPKYWNLAYDTAVYLRNLSPTSSLNSKTPHEVWFGTKPSVTHLRVFGEVAYALIPKHKRTKLDAKAELRVFVGYGHVTGTKGWKLLDPFSDRVSTTSDVRFLHQPVFLPSIRNQNLPIENDDVMAEPSEEVSVSIIAPPSNPGSEFQPVSSASSASSSPSPTPVTAPSSPVPSLEPAQTPTSFELDVGG